jgi:ribosome maturation protein SDO1
MKAQLALPTGIKKLTNIAVVRLKKAGVRFEIACYKNTVVAWRDGFERDLDNVLQTTRVYTNVSKGVFAKEEDVLRAFGTKDESAVCEIILNQGELQVSDKERKVTLENIFRDAVTVLVEKCVNPETNRPYPPGVIERALREIHFSVDPMKGAKQQALAALPKLQTVFPIERAPMRFKFAFADAPAFAARRDQTLEMLATLDAKVERVTETEIVCTADPSAYRACDKFVRERTGGTGRLEVVTMAVMEGKADQAADPAAAASLAADAPRDRATPAGSSDSGVAFATRELSRALAESSSEASSSEASGATRLTTRRVARDAAGEGGGAGAGAGEGTYEILYARGKIAEMPEAFASRRDRFAPLDGIQAGWTVELRKRAGSSVVDAVFFDPDGVGYKAFADARREALRASKN